MNEVLLEDGFRHISVPLIPQMLCGKYYFSSEVEEAMDEVSVANLLAPSCPTCVLAAANLVRLLNE